MTAAHNSSDYSDNCAERADNARSCATFPKTFAQSRHYLTLSATIVALSCITAWHLRTYPRDAFMSLLSRSLKPCLLRNKVVRTRTQVRMAVNLPTLPDVEKLSTNIIRVMGGNPSKVGATERDPPETVPAKTISLSSSEWSSAGTTDFCSTLCKAQIPMYSAPVPSASSSIRARVCQRGRPISPMHSKSTSVP